ncbi:7763_t:CDS:1 [Acaulospora morrowiae]|uniref:7763_t:CDS:1 n=1 Tax=Acaulospora morrowiae TaxID=94023 RepID=A0A9N9G0Q3_9GLOM|nr:7763_t:CDS:1 [Acaulospora morrowiae]
MSREVISSADEVANNPLVIQGVTVNPDLTPERFLEKVKGHLPRRGMLGKDIFDIVVQEEATNENDPRVLRVASTKLWLKTDAQLKEDYKTCAILVNRKIHEHRVKIFRQN